jgi:hypothetical protein
MPSTVSRWATRDTGLSTPTRYSVGVDDIDWAGARLS